MAAPWDETGYQYLAPGTGRQEAKIRNIKPSFGKVDSGGSIPSNMLEPEPPTDLLKFGNNAANDLYTERCKEAGQKIHPARFPAALPEFFIKLLTDEGDIVLDPFAGSNTTGAVAERLERR